MGKKEHAEFLLGHSPDDKEGQPGRGEEGVGSEEIIQLSGPVSVSLALRLQG